MAAGLGIAGCATSPSSPSTLAPRAAAALIPLRDFVANTSFTANYRLSPDGDSLAWLSASGTDAAIQVATVNQLSRRTTFATGQVPRGAQHAWLNDSRHLVYTLDPDGSENTEIWSIDTRHPDHQAVKLTHWGPQVRAALVGLGAAGSSSLYISSNDRDRAVFDLYVADAVTRDVRLLMRNDRRVQQWIIDTQGELAGWVRIGPAGLVLELMGAPGSPPREVIRVPQTDSLRVLRLDRQSQQLLAMTNIHRDKLALVRVALNQPDRAGSLVQEVLASDDRVDLESVNIDQTSGRPLSAQFTPDYPQVQWLDATLEAAVGVAWRQQSLPRPITLRISNSSQDGERLVIHNVMAQGEGEMLFDRKSGRLTPLRPAPPINSSLAPVEPISLGAPDGMTLHGYMLRPRNAQRELIENAPLIVQVHGGPWSRDSWSGGQATQAQFLVNRGYAVLMINYRGSSGYGKAFMESAIMQLGRATQDDITAAVRWAVNKGIADPKRVAVMGASFGGYSTLMQLILHPDIYACGVSQVGVSNWARFLENAPPYWRDSLPLWRRYLGDTRKIEVRLRVLSESPVSQLDRIQAPLLVIHGRHDIRVALQDAEDVVSGLRARGAPVEYLLLDNEGHSVREWREQLMVWRKTETFLAQCLGGRTGGPDPVEAMWPH